MIALKKSKIKNGCSKQSHEGITEQRHLSSHDSNRGLSDGIFCKRKYYNAFLLYNKCIYLDNTNQIEKTPFAFTNYGSLLMETNQYEKAKKVINEAWKSTRSI